MAFVRDYTALITNTSTWNHVYGQGFTAKPVFLTYSFAGTKPPLSDGVSYEDPNYFRPLNEYERGQYRDAINAWSAVSGITFFEVASGLGDIEVGGYKLSGNIAGQGSMPSSGIYNDGSGPALFAPSDRYEGVFLDVETGMNRHVMIHEIGHALGLEHPHDGTDPLLDPSMDHGGNTVMTYNGEPTNLGILDIQAIQALYGTPGMKGMQVASWTWNAGTQTLTQTGTVAAEIIHGTGAHDVIRANGGDDTIVTRSGNDVVHVGGKDFEVNMGSGFDVLHLDFGRGALGYTWRSGDIVSFAERGANSYDMTVMQAERIVFTDAVLAFDVEGVAGQAYRLYQAAFARTPDEEGLGYWIDQMDAGTQLVAVADSFIYSPEFTTKYGTIQTVDDARYVELLYLNTLGREYDQNGFNYWVNALDDNKTNRADLLMFFSDSAENRNKVADQIDDGIWYV